MAIPEAKLSRPSWQLDGARWSFMVSNDTSHSVPRLSWWWRAVGKNGVTWNDDARFLTMLECQADAATHGFNPTHA
ncbi:MAG: hypothetical protein JWN13_3111 [Betaproteobacteria bacterium]|jgi:hypothetical protein|nr:hypothetical protein [Betaproteobacteria bacterium]MEA3152815.1 hypothetical protein [Betaproteobacteria bacterium]